MKVYSAVRIDIDTGETLFEDSFEYRGPIALCCGDDGDDGGDRGGGDHDSSGIGEAGSSAARGEASGSISHDAAEGTTAGGGGVDATHGYSSAGFASHARAVASMRSARRAAPPGVQRLTGANLLPSNPIGTDEQGRPIGDAGVGPPSSTLKHSPPYLPSNPINTDEQGRPRGLFDDMTGIPEADLYPSNPIVETEPFKNAREHAQALLEVRSNPFSNITKEDMQPIVDRYVSEEDLAYPGVARSAPTVIDWGGNAISLALAPQVQFAAYSAGVPLDIAAHPAAGFISRLGVSGLTRNAMSRALARGIATGTYGKPTDAVPGPNVGGSQPVQAQPAKTTLQSPTRSTPAANTEPANQSTSTASSPTTDLGRLTRESISPIAVLPRYNVNRRKMRLAGGQHTLDLMRARGY